MSYGNNTTKHGGITHCVRQQAKVNRELNPRCFCIEGLMKKLFPFRLLSIAAISVLGSLCCIGNAQRIALTPGYMSTVAGTISSSCTSAVTCNDGGVATSAKFGATSVFGARVDSSNDIFVLDSVNDVIKVVYAGGSFASSLIVAAGTASPVVGNIYVIAGTYGTATEAGDNGAAHSATLNVPRGLFVDSFNNVWFSDTGNNRVRVIYAGGTSNPVAALIFAVDAQTAVQGNIYNIAGGGTGATGTLANNQALNSPRGIWVSSSGDLYITDLSNDVIRVVYNGGAVAKQYIVTEAAVTSPVVGDMYIVAGVKGVVSTGSSGSYSNNDGALATTSDINTPHAVGLDDAGNMYIGEYGGARIRKVTLYTGNISTIAGAPVTSTSLSTVCTSAANTQTTYNVFQVSTVCGDGGLATGSLLGTSSIRSLWVDDGGNIYFADSALSRIRKIDVNGYISTIIGNGVGTASTDPGYAFNSLYQPYDVTMDSSGNLYVADVSSDRVRFINVSTTTFTYGGAGGVGIGGIAYELAVVYNNSATTLSLTGLSTPSAPFAQQPSGGTDCSASSIINPGMSCNLLLSAAPTLTTTQTGTESISSNGTNNSGGALINLSASEKSTADSGTVTSVVASAYNIVTGQSITFTSTTQNSTATTNNGFPVGGTVTFLDGATTLGTGSVTNGIASYTTSSLTTSGSHSITASYIKTPTSNGFPASTSTAITVTVTTPSTTTLTVSPASHLADYGVTVTLTATVAASSCAGTVSFYSGSLLLGTATLSSGAATLATTSLAYGTDILSAVYGGSTSCAASNSNTVTETISSQNVWVVNSNGTLSEITQTGSEISPSYGDSGGGSGITFDSSGNVYSVNTNANTLTRFLSNGTSATSTSAAAGGMNGPVAVAVTGTGYIWVANGTGSSLSLFNGGTLTAVSSTAFTTTFNGGGLSTPSALAIDTSGNLWTANSGNNSVTEFVGAADPVVTPQSVATGNQTQGVKP